MFFMLAAGQSQTVSLSSSFTLPILFGTLGPLIAILIAAWDIWYERRRRERSAQGILIYSSYLLMAADQTRQDRDSDQV